MAKRKLDELARFWTQATEEARYALLEKATKENSPPLWILRAAIVAAESEAGTFEEG